MKEDILVIGAGPVGLSTAIGFAHTGLKVACFDVDEERITNLMKNKAPFFECGLQEHIDKCCNNIVFTNNEERAFVNTHIYIIAVGTPVGKNGNVDMTSFWSAIDLIERNMKRDCIIVVKSTVPIGTNQRVVNHFIRAQSQYKVRIVSNPEFLAQGTSIEDTIHTSRIVIGCNDDESRKEMLRIYSGFDCEKIVTTPKSAELIKYESNCYLAMRISFVNDLAVTCELIGADVKSVLRGVSLDPRIGSNYFAPGFGYGGSCFPKDTVCFHNQIQREYGHELELIEATMDINKRQCLRLSRKIEKRCGDLFDQKIGILGLAFKKNTDDVRNSLAVEIISYLLENGAIISVWDPVAEKNCRKIFGDSINYLPTMREVIDNNEVILIGTDWDDVVNMDLTLLKGKCVYDGRNCWLDRIDEIDFEYAYVGGSKNCGK